MSNVKFEGHLGARVRTRTKRARKKMTFLAECNLADAEERRLSRNSEYMGKLRATTNEINFISGSKYKGTWNSIGMAGVGRYTLPCNATFKGELRDGMFHGYGSITWPRGQTISGVWHAGECTDRVLLFSDGLIYDEDDFKYCKFPDRRFYICIQDGLRPAGNTLKTNRLRSRVIPPNCYDVIFGVFDPKIYCIMSHNYIDKILEIPKEEKARWIKKHCRKGFMESTGYRPWLHENWFRCTYCRPKLPYSLPASEDSPESWWKRLTTFVRDEVVRNEAAGTTNSSSS